MSASSTVRTPLRETSPPTMLGSYGQYSSSSGYSSGNEAACDVKPYSQSSESGRMVNGDGRIVTSQSSGYSHIISHTSPNMYQPGAQHDNMVYVLPSDSKASLRQQMEILPKSAGSRWREEETMALVEIWRDKICQTRWWKQNKCVRVNKEMWDEIANMLMEKGIYRTASQCQIRMKNLLQYFRQLVDHRRTEKSRDELPNYFDIVNNIMNGRSEAEMWRKRKFEEGEDDMDDSMFSSEGGNSNSGPPETRVNDHNKSNHSSPGPVKQEADLKLTPPNVADGKSSVPRRHGSARMTDSPIVPVVGHRRTASMSPHSVPPPHDMFPTREISRHPSLREPTPREPETATGAGLLTTSMNGPIPGQYPPPPSAQFPPHSIHHPDGFILRNPPTQRFPMASRVCLPIASHHMPGSEPHPDGRCSGHGCCEPPLKRHCPDIGCSTPTGVAKPGHFSEYSASSKHPKLSRNSGFASQSEGPRMPPFTRESMHKDTASRSPISPQTARESEAEMKKLNSASSASSSPDKRGDGSKSSQSLGQSQEEWMVSMKELMQHQQKQMEMLLEVEQKRLEIEEKRLRAQEEADTRNGQFIMEAMRILAEALSKGDRNGNTIPAEAITKLNGTVNGDVSPTKE